MRKPRPKTAQPITAKISYLANDGAPSRRESDAFHESGHAVVATLLGVQIDAIELLPAGSTPSAKFRFGTVKPEQHDAVVIIAKAGLLAELAFNPDTPRTPRRQDERIARRAIHGRLDLIFPAPRQEYLASAELEALKLVAAHLPVIAALANELLSKGKLSGAAVTDFVRQQLSLSGTTPVSVAKSTA
jgi:hypothetical protein